ncbi:MAG: A/G-specific adenine glycosylase, partial [Pedosphaera sp.]|nr:A/G-specific adenine glycosylase [Pedosphaera sp.]
CPACPVRASCNARRTHRVDQLPNLGPRAAATARQFIAFVIQNRGHYLVRQRRAGQVNAHLWEFPNLEITAADNSTPAQLARKHLGLRLNHLTELCTIRHTITRYRITLQAFRAAIPKSAIRNPQSAIVWLPLAQLDTLAFTSAHRKILHQLQDMEIAK